MPHITGQTIYLREYRGSDLELINKWRSLEEITSWTAAYVWPESLEQTHAFLEAQLNNSDPANRKFAICRNEDDQYIGHIGYEKLDLLHHSTELGIVIGQPQSLSKGMGTEAVQLFLKVCFDEMGLHRVGLYTLERNERARRCYEKCGFKQEGIVRECYFAQGRWQSFIAMSILEPEYRAMTHQRDPQP